MASPAKSNPETQNRTYQEIMRERWLKSNKFLPVVDHLDLNMNMCSTEQRQHSPELSQVCYLRIRSLEEAFPMHNYFNSKVVSADKSYITFKDRSFAIQKIFELHSIKKYKIETLF
jgi:hypothetical protein